MRTIRSARSILASRVVASRVVAGLAPLALAAGLGILGAVVPSVLAPQSAQAYVSRLSVSLDHEKGASFESLMRRAEAVARAAAQRGFDSDILASQVVVTVNGAYRGAEVPLLTLDVSRYQWRNQPDSRRWATYYPNARMFLGIRNGEARTPDAAPVAAPTAPAQPGTGAIPKVAPLPAPPPLPGVAPTTRRLPVPKSVQKLVK
jgi:hypothetical protein